MEANSPPKDGASQARMADRDLLAAILQSLADGIVATDPEGRVAFMNAVAERYARRPLADCLGHPVERVIALVHERTGEALDVPVRAAIREKRVCSNGEPMALGRADAGGLPIDGTAAPVLNDTGHVLGGVFVFQDAAERRKRARDGAMLAAIVASAQDAVIGFDADGTITSWNPAAERLTGYSAAEAIGQKTTILAPAEGVGAMGDAIHRIARGESVAPYEAIRLRKDGSAFEASVSLSVIRDDAGRTAGFASALRDVSHLRQLEAQYRQAQKMEAVGILAGGVAHDFNNLLTVINGYSAVLLQEPQPHARQQMLHEIRDAGERAAKLTRQLLAFSRKQTLQPAVVNLNEVVVHLGRMLKRLIGEEIAIAMALAPDLDFALADPGQIEQAVMNLAVNARDAMPAGGRLTLATANVALAEARDFIPPGRYVRLSVSDTGCGMADDVKARIFEPFFTTKGLGKGTGLGLSMVYGFVKQSGGFITVSSMIDAGTTFEILLPRTDLPAPVDADGEPAGPPARPGDTVLLVEDEDPVRRFAARALQSHGYVVLEASNATEGVQVAEAHAGPIHLLATDVVLPGGGGRALADAVRRRRPDLKTLFVSGYLDDAVVRHGVSNKTDNFLQKPFTPQALCLAVHRLLADARSPSAAATEERP